MKRQQRTLIRAVMIIAVMAGILAVIILLSDQDWNARFTSPENREEGNEAFMNEGVVTWNGKQYRKKGAMTTILVAGIDKEETTASSYKVSYRDGGQADFLLLLAIDHEERKVHQLQIDRDTMAEVTVLGVYGNVTGTRELQICLAHNYGARPEEQAGYTVEAVSRVLNGFEIDGYCMFGYGAVPDLNDLLGGIPVTVPEDMTSVNPEWVAGRTLTLKGQEAETFVRTRKTIGSGSNQERMTRQAVYMRSAIEKMRNRFSQDNGFVKEFLALLHQVAVTNMSDQRLLTEINDAKRYQILPVDYLAGEYVLGEYNYIEFYPEEGSAEAWVMTHLYQER